MERPAVPLEEFRQFHTCSSLQLKDPAGKTRVSTKTWLGRKITSEVEPPRIVVSSNIPRGWVVNWFERVLARQHCHRLSIAQATDRSRPALLH